MLRNIHHVAFLAEDLGAATERFEAAFGMDLVGEKVIEEPRHAALALYAAGDNLVEFVSPLSPGNAAYRALQERGEGFYHIAYEVDDLDAAVERVREAGFEFETDEPYDGVAWRGITLRESDTLVTTELVEDGREDRFDFDL